MGMLRRLLEQRYPNGSWMVVVEEALNVISGIIHECGMADSEYFPALIFYFLLTRVGLLGGKKMIWKGQR